MSASTSTPDAVAAAAANMCAGVAACVCSAPPSRSTTSDRSGATAVNAACSSLSHGALPSHHAREDTSQSKPHPSSALASSRAMPGVWAMNTTPGSAARARLIR